MEPLRWMLVLLLSADDQGYVHHGSADCKAAFCLQTVSLAVDGRMSYVQVDAVPTTPIGLTRIPIIRPVIRSLRGVSTRFSSRPFVTKY